MGGWRLLTTVPATLRRPMLGLSDVREARQRIQLFLSLNSAGRG
jgi:hypothetical protein